MARLKSVTGILLLCLFAFSSTKSEEIVESVELETVVYEELGNGTVVVNVFNTSAPRSLDPIFGDYNPNPRLESCSKLGAGRFPVTGDCGKYLECHAESSSSQNVTYTRRIVQCLHDLWFQNESGDCGFKTEVCPVGRLVPPTPVVRLAQRTATSTTTSCTSEGYFPQPGCVGFYQCTKATYGFQRNDYSCNNGLYNEATKTCDLEWRVTSCSVPLPEDACLRECRDGDTRVCKYKFIVQEHVSMSTVHCGNCPFVMSDCNLPGCISAGGLQRPLISINKKMPGPTVQVCKGDIIEVDVVNQLQTSSVTIHWHGLHQRATPFMDGVPYLTQCPILPGNSFRYRMTADVAGTHIYHSHIGHLDSDGLYGAMIVREQRSTEPGLVGRYDVDLPQHTLLIWHWFEHLGEVQSLDTRLLSQRREGFGLLINGKGIVGQRFSPNGNRRLEPIEEYFINSDSRRYRFRIIFNSAIMCPVQISIDGHDLEVLAVDGQAVQNEGRVSSLILSAGERVDIVPLATQWTRNSAFYIRVRGMTDCDDQKNSVHQYAILRYDNYTGPVLNFPPPSYNSAIRSGRAYNLNREIFNPVTQTRITASPLVGYRSALNRSNLEGTPDKRIFIDISFNRQKESDRVQMVFPQLNNVSWSSPSFPLLTQWQQITDRTLCTDEIETNRPAGCTERHCICTHTLIVKTGQLVELALFDPRGVAEIGHPFHLHGHLFKVVGQHLFNGPTNTLEVERLVNSNQITTLNPYGPWKDTVIVPGRGILLIRFRADNPGYWMFHCHIGEHAALGMALAFKVGEHNEMVQPPANFPKCGNFA